MTEIFADISDNVKQIAQSIWDVTYKIKDPLYATKFLDNALKYYAHLFSEYEMSFIKFYIEMKMEELK